jgi:hypothetical protein
MRIIVTLAVVGSHHLRDAAASISEFPQKRSARQSDSLLVDTAMASHSGFAWSVAVIGPTGQLG